MSTNDRPTHPEPDSSEPDPFSPDADQPKSFRFPSALTVLFAVTVLVWLLAFVIPTGTYQTDGDTGRPVPGTYERVDAGLSFGDRLMQLFLAPVNGLYGVLNGDGFVGPYESGELYGAAGVFLFVLAIGVFITLAMQTGAIDNGVARVALRMRSRGWLLIAVLMVLFSIGGTTEGMAEETLGFYTLVIPLMLALGYDRMVATGTIMVGAGVGVLASTVNPFATGVASDSADISIGDGIGFRLLMYVLLVPIAIWWVLRYAKRTRADSTKSLVGPVEGDDELIAQGVRDVQRLSGRDRLVLTLVGLTFVFMIFAIVPWAQIINGPEADSYVWQLDWYFPELAALFIVMSLVVGVVGGLGEKGVTDGVVRGAGDFIGVGLVIVLARGVTVIMNNSEITDTVLHSMERAVSDTSSWVFGGLMFLVNVPLAFLVPSTSGHAALAMPILAPLADFAGVSRAMVVTAFQSASGVVNLITPTSAVVMGGLALAKVRYDQYLRFVMPLVGILFVASLVLVSIGAAIS
ncbi:YfcC family protein [Nocardioides campestrisoli]|uniref:YfcC family protein n=1 Tax=Nocardioides campestrisoli TaxID=2736757 RepID=UPI0015E7D9DE|nr:YfcC family protein [Nocardioides campestrisoli]